MLSWDAELCERLANGARFVIRYDIRDAGRLVTYEPGAPPYALRDLVADAVGLLDTLGLASAHLVGMSLGSAIAQVLALEHPDRVASLTLGANLTNHFMLEAGDPWRQRLGEVAAPALVVHGTEDPLFPIGHARALANEIPGAELLALEQTGHEYFPRATWDLVVPAILRHASGVPAGAGSAQ